MPLTVLGSGVQWAIDTVTGILHIVRVSGANVVTDIAAVGGGVIAGGLPIPLQSGALSSGLADAGTDNFTGTNTVVKAAITRACTSIKVVPGASGIVISLDGGTTASISLPAGLGERLFMPIPINCDIRIKRGSTGVALVPFSQAAPTGFIIEVG
jgi:hypothetical protein